MAIGEWISVQSARAALNDQGRLRQRTRALGTRTASHDLQAAKDSAARRLVPHAGESQAMLAPLTMLWDQQEQNAVDALS
jgi:hypothetical protein